MIAAKDDRTSGVKRIHSLGFTLSDIYELETELKENVRKLEGDEREKRRICRVICSRMAFLRSIITAEKILERSGVEVIR